MQRQQVAMRRNKQMANQMDDDFELSEDSNVRRSDLLSFTSSVAQDTPDPDVLQK